ncbi:MAG: aspartate-semialdehyde dehydrogenase [Planctomycetota bacterium]|nr:aspartate-semialdehyde dehydrogenase [Planctomycetota bacterium]
MINTLAIVGATGAVGKIILEQIISRNFPAKNIKLLASSRSAGKTIACGNKTLTVEALSPDAFRGVEVAIGSTPDEVAAEFVPWAVEHGTVVVDESAHFRMQPDVPLVVPEINPEAIHLHKGVIASPNCSTTQMVMVLKPLHDAANVRRVLVSTYQAVSGAGIAATQELRDGMQAWLSKSPENPSVFTHPIAANLIPQIGSAKEEGSTSEELKMVQETRKIFNDDTIGVCATCVRVPVADAHSESLIIETERPLSPEEATRLLSQFPGVTINDNLSESAYPMPRDAGGRDDVFVGRIRRDPSGQNSLAMWCVSDNLRKGAATNAVQIAEHVAREMTA